MCASEEGATVIYKTQHPAAGGSGILTGPGHPPRGEGLTPEKIWEAAPLKEAMESNIHI